MNFRDERMQQKAEPERKRRFRFTEEKLIHLDPSSEEDSPRRRSRSRSRSRDRDRDRGRDRDGGRVRDRDRARDGETQWPVLSRSDQPPREREQVKRCPEAQDTARHLDSVITKVGGGVGSARTINGNLDWTCGHCNYKNFGR